MLKRLSTPAGRRKRAYSWRSLSCTHTLTSDTPPPPLPLTLLPLGVGGRRGHRRRGGRRRQRRPEEQPPPPRRHRHREEAAIFLVFPPSSCDRWGDCGAAADMTRAERREEGGGRGGEREGTEGLFRSAWCRAALRPQNAREIYFSTVDLPKMR